jgi:hypothetical protein
LKLSVSAEDIAVFNLQGKMLHRSKGNSVDVSMLKTGIYIVKAIYQGESTTKKIFKN